jgi:PIN domain nuclease of toxin-antitoxin system
MLLTAFGIYVVASLLYIRRLHVQLRGYEHIWQQIESVADKNEDGKFTIDIQHLEDAHQDPLELHATAAPSSIRLLTLDGNESQHRVA